jgi:glutamine transport system permease protein
MRSGSQRPGDACRPIFVVMILLAGLFGASMLLRPPAAAAEGETYLIATDITFAPFGWW